MKSPSPNSIQTSLSFTLGESPKVDKLCNDTLDCIQDLLSGEDWGTRSFFGAYVAVLDFVTSWREISDDGTEIVKIYDYSQPGLRGMRG